MRLLQLLTIILNVRYLHLPSQSVVVLMKTPKSSIIADRELCDVIVFTKYCYIKLLFFYHIVLV